MAQESRMLANFQQRDRILRFLGETDVLPLLLVLARRGAVPVKIRTGNNFHRKYHRIPHKFVTSTGAKFW